MLDAGPADVADVDQALDARLQLDERPEVRHVGDDALHDVPLVDPLADGQPRVPLNLFDAQGDAVLLPVEADDLDGGLVALLVEVADADVALPRDLADVDEAVHGALEVHEDAEVRDAADFAL